MKDCDRKNHACAQLPCISHSKIKNQDLNHQEASLSWHRRAEQWAPLSTHPVMQRQAASNVSPNKEGLFLKHLGQTYSSTPHGYLGKGGKWGK